MYIGAHIHMWTHLNLCHLNDKVPRDAQLLRLLDWQNVIFHFSLLLKEPFSVELRNFWIVPLYWFYYLILELKGGKESIYNVDKINLIL